MIYGTIKTSESEFRKRFPSEEDKQREKLEKIYTSGISSKKVSTGSKYETQIQKKEPTFYEGTFGKTKIKEFEHKLPKCQIETSLYRI